MRPREILLSALQEERFVRRTRTAKIGPGHNHLYRIEKLYRVLRRRTDAGVQEKVPRSYMVCPAQKRAQGTCGCRGHIRKGERGSAPARLQSAIASAEQKGTPDPAPRNHRVRKIRRTGRNRGRLPAPELQSVVYASRGPTLMRGSTVKISISANRFPAIRNTEESTTTPVTMYTSRERIASRRSGPKPGQLMMTSTRSDALSIVATESPKSEMRGLIAAGRAKRNRSRARRIPCPRATRMNGAVIASTMADRTCRSSVGNVTMDSPSAGRNR